MFICARIIIGDNELNSDNEYDDFDDVSDDDNQEDDVYSDGNSGYLNNSEVVVDTNDLASLSFVDMEMVEDSSLVQVVESLELGDGVVENDGDSLIADCMFDDGGSFVVDGMADIDGCSVMFDGEDDSRLMVDGEDDSRLIVDGEDDSRLMVDGEDDDNVMTDGLMVLMVSWLKVQMVWLVV